MIKGTIQQEDITLINIYAPNIRAPKYNQSKILSNNLKQILMDINGEMKRNTVIVGDFNTSLTLKDRSSTQKINKKIAAINNTLDQMDLIGIFRVFHPKAAEYTYFSSTLGTFSRIDHILGHKINLNKFKKTQIISNIFSDHNAM